MTGTNPGGIRALLSHSAGRGLGVWSFIALVLGIVSDFSQPLAPVATSLLGLALLVFVLSVAGLFVPRFQSAAALGTVFSGVAVVIFGLIVFGQGTIAPAGEGRERGLAASYIDPLAATQNAILPVSDDQRTMMRFSSAIGQGSDTMRASAARAIITETQDPMLRRGMIEMLYDTARPSLRQTAIILAMRARQGSDLPIIPQDDGSAFARSLTGTTFHISRVDEASGGLNLVSSARQGDGTIARNGVTLSLFYRDSEGIVPMQVVLVPQDDYELVGEARLTSGQSAKVSMPLL